MRSRRQWILFTLLAVLACGRVGFTQPESAYPSSLSASSGGFTARAVVVSVVNTTPPLGNKTTFYTTNLTITDRSGTTSNFSEDASPDRTKFLEIFAVGGSVDRAPTVVLHLNSCGMDCMYPNYVFQPNPLGHGRYRSLVDAGESYLYAATLRDAGRPMLVTKVVALDDAYNGHPANSYLVETKDCKGAVFPGNFYLVTYAPDGTTTYAPGRRPVAGDTLYEGGQHRFTFGARLAACP